MNKLHSYISILLFSLAIGFLCLIVYVSLLGDNHKINFVVEQYFTDMKNSNYEVLCGKIDLPNINEGVNCSDCNFLLETAMLKKFKLLGVKDYSVEIKRSHFWIPWITDDTVTISVAPVPKKENLIKSFVKNRDLVYINNFMTIKKHHKLWQIQKINLEATSLGPVFNKLKKEMNLNKYIRKTEKGYSLNQTEVDMERLSPLGRRLFEYSMSKL